MTRELLSELRRLGVKLRLEDEKLHVIAPAGVLTPELREQLRLNRDALTAIVRRAEGGDAPPEITPRPESRYEPFALTEIQHAYWVGRNPAVEFGGVSTHAYVEFETGLDLSRLGRSLNAVIERHDMLRAIIQPDGRQRILREVPAYEIATHDLRGLTPEAQDAHIGDIRAEMAHQVLPADRWPLFDVRASRLDDTRSRLHVSLDMLILDGFSVGLLYQDWQRFYEEPGRAAAQLELSYRDFVLAEESLRAGRKYAEDREYWLGRLDELPPPPELPLATGQPKRSQFTRRHTRLPREQWEAVKATARHRGVTPSAVLMTAFSDVLRSWSKRPDFTLNLTLFNRPPLHPQIGEIIGDFTTVLLLGVEAGPDAPFAVRVEALHRRLIQDLDHLSYSGIRVLRERARRLGGRPGAAMPIVFTSLIGLDQARSAPAAAHFLGEVVHSVSQTPQVWLDHQVMEDRGELLVNWDCVESLFPGGMLDDMFVAYCSVLDRLSRDESAWDEKTPLVALPAWQAGERDQANGTAMPIPSRTLSELVEAQAELSPDADAVISPDAKLTYRELMDDAYRLAHRLIELGAAANTLIAVVAERGTEQIAAVLGVSRCGAAYLPIDPQWPAARRQQLLDQGRVRIVVTTPRLRDELDWPQNVTTVTFADAEVRGAAAVPPQTAPAPGDLAYVIFTSGSTGQPKGVMINHHAAANTVQDINARYQVGPADRVLALSALSFDLSVYDVFGVLAAGGAVITPSPAKSLDPSHWSELVDRHGVTLWNTVPALMQVWMDAHERANAAPGQRLRVVLLSGDWIPVALPDRIRAIYPAARVISLGGATEASIWSVEYPIGEVPKQWTRIPYGKPLANQTLHVYNEWLEPCPVWTEGGIHIGGVGVAAGYWADPEKTAERFIIHPKTQERLYRTGDVGRYLPGGDIEFLGRDDSQVKINGYRIELGEIAAALRRQPAVAEAVVTVDANPRTGQRRLVAHVVPADAGRITPDAAALREALEHLLPEYMVPRHYLFITRIPLSANGKVDLSALPAPSDAAAASETTAPRDELERKLFEFWREALGRDDFGIEENFFELGGDSLHAIRVLGRMKDELGIEDSADDGLQRLFDNPSVAGLAAALRSQ